MTEPAGLSEPIVPVRAADWRPGWVFYSLLGGFVLSCAAGFLLPLTITDLESPPPGARAAALGIVIFGTLLSVTLHEWAHAMVAYRGGDTSVVGKGYLRLDFRRYSDPLLSIVMPVLFVLMGGLPLPGGAVWINQAALRSRRWRSAVALAGAPMNFLVGLAAAAVVGSGILGEDHLILSGALAYLATIMFGITVLNLLPIPGLDGYAALEPYLPAGIRQPVDKIRPYGIWIIVGLMLLGAFGFIWTIADAVLSALGVEQYWLAVGAYLARFQ